MATLDTPQSFKKQLEELMMDFVGAYESFDEIPEARETALTSIINLVDEKLPKKETHSHPTRNYCLDCAYRDGYNNATDDIRAIIREAGDK